jgi:hypothetical protein
MPRPKGSKNKHSFQVEEIAHRFQMEPFEFAMHVMNGNWKELGYDSQYKTILTDGGEQAVVDENVIKLENRIKCAEFASKYLYSPKQAVDPKTGDTSIRMIFEDYTSKKDSK